MISDTPIFTLLNERLASSTAAFVVGLVRGKSFQDSMRHASAAAALCLTKKGAMPSMPTKEEVNKFLESFSTHEADSKHRKKKRESIS